MIIIKDEIKHILIEKNFMFYEFKNCEYYGLILAKNEKEAKKGYMDIFPDIIAEKRQNLHPSVITIDKALEYYRKSIIDGCDTEAEKENDFYKLIGSFINTYGLQKNKYLVILIDGGLL